MGRAAQRNTLPPPPVILARFMTAGVRAFKGSVASRPTEAATEYRAKLGARNKAPATSRSAWLVTKEMKSTNQQRQSAFKLWLGAVEMFSSMRDGRQQR